MLGALLMAMSAPLAQADTEDESDRATVPAVANVDGAATGGIDDLGVRDRTFSLDDLDVGIAGVVGEPRTVDNAVLYEGAGGVDHVVRKMDDGAQFLSVINQRDSSTEVRYDFPEHYLEIADTGYVVTARVCVFSLWLGFSKNEVLGGPCWHSGS